MPTGRVIAVGLPILGVLATLFLASAVDGDSPGSGAGGQGVFLACGCSPPGVMSRFDVPAVQAALQQRIANPSAKVDLPLRRNIVAAAPGGRLANAPPAQLPKPVDDVTASQIAVEPAAAPLDEEAATSAPLRASILPGGPVLLLPVGDAAKPILPPDEDTAPVDPSEPSGGEIDGASLRRVLAGTLAGKLAEHTRPSRLLGQSGAPTLLGTGLDSLWNIGQQAAVGVLVDGKLPDRQQLQRQAVQVVAAAAQQEVASLISDATQFGEDNGIRFLRKLELRGGWSPGARPALEARTIDSLFQSAALDHTLFLQAGVVTDFTETTANIGAGYRYQLPDSDWMLGLNAFYDRQFPIGHERVSLGIEASTSDFTLFANRYIGLSGWTDLNPGLEERPLSGWDVGLAGQMPQIEDLHLSLAAFRWEQQSERDRMGLRLMADYAVSPALQFGATLAGDDAGNVEAGFRLTWQMGGELFGGGDMAPTPWTDRRLAFVNRENEIVTESREVPKDYDIAFVPGEVTAANATAVGFTLSGAPLQSRYSYRIASNAAGLALSAASLATRQLQTISGSGLVTQDPQTISGIDVSSLADGTLTLTIQVVTKDGAAGPEVSTTIAKSTESLDVSVEALASSPTNQSPVPFRITFSRAVTGLEIGDLLVTNGSATNLASGDATTWTVDVTPAGQGAVTLQVPADAASAESQANTASNVASVLHDSEAPSGYLVAFLAGPVTATGFEISNADVGAGYAFTITSSGGGTPVTGSGTVASATQQVTGLDLTGLADGTLTLSLTLTDAVGNAGVPATATMTKDASPLVILAITPPAPGDFDDL